MIETDESSRSIEIGPMLAATMLEILRSAEQRSTNDVYQRDAA
jgi:hypothetical protein